MNQLKLGALVLLLAGLAGCGGGGGADLPAKPKFASQIVFGDSLSDVGTYKTGVVTVLGGGQFTINQPGVATNWTEQIAPQLGLSSPCAAEVGIDDGTGATGMAAGTVVTPVFNANCLNYAQGGARVTDPVGIGNKSAVPAGFALTVPVKTQIENHLATHGGTFSGNEIVFVMSGANDVFTQAGLVGAGAITPASAVAAVQTAASELANYVQTQIVGKGAKYVVVMNVPDISSTPQVTTLTGAALAQSQGLFTTLVGAFNGQLKASLPDSANVLNVDAYSASKDEVANPARYNLTNVASTACNLTSPYPNPLKSSLACNASNLNAGETPTTHYLFADNVHPTPYGHALFATYVLQAMTNKGWF